MTHYNFWYINFKCFFKILYLCRRVQRPQETPDNERKHKREKESYHEPADVQSAATLARRQPPEVIDKPVVSKSSHVSNGDVITVQTKPSTAPVSALERLDCLIKGTATTGLPSKTAPEEFSAPAAGVVTVNTRPKTPVDDDIEDEDFDEEEKPDISLQGMLKKELDIFLYPWRSLRHNGYWCRNWAQLPGFNS